MTSRSKSCRCNRRKLRRSLEAAVYYPTSIGLGKPNGFQSTRGSYIRHEVSLCFFPEGKARTLRLHHKGWSLRLLSVSARGAGKMPTLPFGSVRVVLADLSPFLLNSPFLEVEHAGHVYAILRCATIPLDSEVMPTTKLQLARDC